ncbi:MAG: hypothetical protein R3F20_16240 [Planctomycetota bacterium]
MPRSSSPAAGWISLVIPGSKVAPVGSMLAEKAMTPGGKGAGRLMTSTAGSPATKVFSGALRSTAARA